MVLFDSNSFKWSFSKTLSLMHESWVNLGWVWLFDSFYYESPILMFPRGIRSMAIISYSSPNKWPTSWSLTRGTFISSLKCKGFLLLIRFISIFLGSIGLGISSVEPILNKPFVCMLLLLLSYWWIVVGLKLTWDLFNIINGCCTYFLC